MKEIRKIIPATKTHARRVDYEYERNASLAAAYQADRPIKYLESPKN